MENVVISPQPGQTVVATHDHNQHNNQHGHHVHGHDSVEARADFRSLTNEVERFGTLNGDRIKDGFSISGDRVNAVGSLAQAGFSGVHDRLCDSTGKVIDAVGTVGTAGALAACETDKYIADLKLAGAILAKDQVIAQNVGFSAQQVLSQTIGNAQSVLSNAIGNAAQVQATANYNGLVVQGTNFFNQTTVQIERVSAEIEAKMSAGFSAGTLLAFQNKADSDAKLAECCCEQRLAAARAESEADKRFCALQALITSTGQAGRDQVNEIEARRQAERIQFLETQNLILTGGLGLRKAA